MTDTKLILREATLADEKAIREAIGLWIPSPGFQFLRGLDKGETFAQFLETCDKSKRGIDLAPGFVPDSTFFAFVGNEVVGRSNLRHELNDHLAQVGGHIGYGVLPKFRRLGYATEILKQTLAFARQLGLSKALVTCDDDNIGSLRAIERCGGVLENKIEVNSPQHPTGTAKTEVKTVKRRYWIQLK